MKCWLTLAVLAMAGAQITLGQQTSTSINNKALEAKNAQAASSLPPPGMQRLIKAFAGSWSTVEKDEPDQDHPTGASISGQEIWRTLPGGALLEEYHLKPGNETGDHSAIVWWDTKAGRYEGLWCAGFNEQGCSTFELKWNGDQIVMSGAYLQGTDKQTWYEVYTFHSPTAYTQTLDIGRPGQGLERVSTIHATRASNGAGAPFSHF